MTVLFLRNIINLSIKQKFTNSVISHNSFSVTWRNQKKMSILCLGPKGSGKTLLLTTLQDPDYVNETTHSIPTVGTNIFTIKLPVKEGESSKKNQNVKKYVQVRELGGTMAPMWKNYYDGVEKILYVIDTSNLCQISAAGEQVYRIIIWKIKKFPLRCFTLLNFGRATSSIRTHRTHLDENGFSVSSDA